MERLCTLVFAKDVIILGGSPFLIKKESVEGIINFKDWEMLEILLDALHGKDSFREGFSSDGMFSFRNPVGVSIRRVDLPDPPRIPITRHADKDVWLETSELKLIKVDFGGGWHGSSVALLEN